MAGCGYVCPLCEGRGMQDNGEECLYCQPAGTSAPMNGSDTEKASVLDREEWIRKVHEGPCCWDDGVKPEL